MIPMRQRNGTLSPWSDLLTIRRDMDDLLSSLSWRQGEGEGAALLSPPVNVWEDAENLYVEAEIPGVDASDLDISVEDRMLRIAGEKRYTGEQRDRDSFHVFERRYGRFERAFTLPRHVDPDRITAECDNGVLRLVLPKHEKARPRRIQVQGADGEKRPQEVG